MTNDEWEGWEDWLEGPYTRRLLAALRMQASHFEEIYKERLFSEPQDATRGQFPQLRAMALAYRELSELDRKMIEGLMDEHDRD